MARARTEPDCVTKLRAWEAVSRREWERERYEQERMEDLAVMLRERKDRWRNLRTIGWGLLGLGLVLTILYCFVVLPTLILTTPKQ